jgi:hypothetical protein
MNQYESAGWEWDTSGIKAARQGCQHTQGVGILGLFDVVVKVEG